ncbi:hypothetical protein NRP93_000361 [Clostridium botulinum]|nr:hypothetical protein [Clostridium botulinum]
MKPLRKTVKNKDCFVRILDKNSNMGEKITKNNYLKLDNLVYMKKLKQEGACMGTSVVCCC